MNSKFSFFLFFLVVLLLGCSKMQVSLHQRFPKEKSFQRADDYLKRRLYQKALNEYESILSLHPNDFEIRKRIAYVYYKERNWENAVSKYSELAGSSKEKEIILNLYRSKRMLYEEDSLKINELKKEMKFLAKQFLGEIENRERTLSTAYELFFMADTESLSIKPFKSAIVEEFPNSKTAFDIIGNEFYSGLYPIWRNDSAKIEYLESFLKKYHETEWRYTIYQYLLSSLHKRKQYNTMAAVGERLVKEESMNPFAYNYVAYLFIESGKNIGRAEKYAIKAIELEPDYAKPGNLAIEQWELNKKALYGDARMTLARALHAQGKTTEAEKWITEAIENTNYGVDDYKSIGPYCYIRGMIQENSGNYSDAKHSYCLSLIEGDVNNKWTVKADSALAQISEISVLTCVRNELDYSGIVFEDVTDRMGFGGIKASRIAWGDYNGDGYDDVLLTGSKIFINRKGEGFEEVTEDVGIQNYTASGGIWGDWNNDGLLDFYSISGGQDEKGDRLWRQTEEGIFVDATQEAGGISNDYSTEGAGWGDANGDGFLDLYLANYENWSEHSYYPDAFYFCREGKIFDEVLNDVGMSPPFNEERAGRGVNWGDYDNDGDLDIYVSNYRLQENFLWQNNGNGIFTNVANLSEVAGDEVEGWWGHTIGSSWGDYDNDGDLDLVTANLAHPRYIEFSNKTKLYENLGPPDWRFVDRRKDSGIKFEETHSDPAWADMDNDGDLDLYITSVYEGRKSFLYENLGNGTFKDITYLSGTRVYNGWGCAFSDFDNDGDLDLFVASGSGVHLFENKGNENNYLEVKLIGTRSNSSGIGARIKVNQGGKTQIREVQGGKGTTSQNSFVQFFGLGDDDTPVDIEVRFLSGVMRIQKNSIPNQMIEIKE